VEISKSQLREIIKKEIYSLHESNYKSLAKSFVSDFLYLIKKGTPLESLIGDYVQSWNDAAKYTKEPKIDDGSLFGEVETILKKKKVKFNR
tara:strand:+ start:85 stop:357 length:273 start_codon:yes stop_codon:yes gene_type:complete